MNDKINYEPVSNDKAHLKNVAEWEASKVITPEIMETARKILLRVIDGADVFKTIRANPVPKHGNISKDALVKAYREMVANGEIQEDPHLLAKIRMKPNRTLSGVSTVTVLTRPFPCPGNCIFCPNDARMPKSYLPDEPGAARAFQNHFDPFAQVRSRLDTYQALGHPTDKVELLILGGSWTSYPEDYQAWFVQRCLDAMNESDSESLLIAQQQNETAAHRNVGLVVETRPDEITESNLKYLRKLGVTKIQIGIQSLDDEILNLNRRGHTVQQALEASKLCRAAGFKLVMHWMPNLLGSTPQSDREDFMRLWVEADQGLGFCPDELKIYPTQLVENSDLYEVWRAGKYLPYDTETLIDLIAGIKPFIPPYCRVNRIIRDIPSHHIVAGNTRSSLRMDIHQRMAENGTRCNCIRCREIRDQAVDPMTLKLVDYSYHAAESEEHFLQFVTPEDKIAGYLRLSLPTRSSPNLDITDLNEAAIIREIHVYGQELPVGTELKGAAQHTGLGKKLINKAVQIAKNNNFKKLAVISAIGTRKYYESRGFSRGEYYMVMDLTNK